MLSVNLFFKFHNFCLWAWRLCILNFLWVITVLLGFGLFTFGPATTAVFTLIRQWSRQNEVKVIRGYFSHIKKGYVKNMLVGMLTLLLGVVLYLDIYYNDNFYLMVIYLVMGLIYLGTTFFIYPITVHFHWTSIRKLIKYSFVYFIRYFPYVTLGLLLVAVFFFLSLEVYPLLFPLFGMTLPAYMVMSISLKIFARVELQAEMQ